MTEVTTTKGLKLSVDEEALDDMRFMELLSDFEGGNILTLGKMAGLLLGQENKEKLYKSLENEKGRVPIEDVSEELTGIMGQIKTAKNS